MLIVLIICLKVKTLTKKGVAELSKYAFEILGLKTLQIIAHKDNIPSIKVALANDFKWIKTLEKVLRHQANTL